MDVDRAPTLTHFEDQGVGSQERVRPGIQWPGPERLDLRIEVAGHLRHLGLGKPGDAQGLDQLLHPHRLPLPASDQDQPATRTLLTTARAGTRIIAADPALRALASSRFLAALSAGATSALLVVLARDHLHTGAGGYGLLLGAIAVGAAAGPVLLIRLVRDSRSPAFVFGAYALRGLVDLCLAIVSTVPVALVAVAGYGLGTSTGAVTFNSLLQARTPAHLRGRVFASFDLIWQLGRLTSLVAGGLAADFLGIQAVYYLGGLLLLLAVTEKGVRDLGPDHAIHPPLRCGGGLRAATRSTMPRVNRSLFSIWNPTALAVASGRRRKCSPPCGTVTSSNVRWIARTTRDEPAT